MTNGRIILVGGGVRSGKSDFALRLARRLGPRRAFLATGEARDDEMRSRIELHRSSRGHDFTTIEEPFEVPTVLRRMVGIEVVVLDCLTLWLSNLLLRDERLNLVLRQVDELVTVLRQRSINVVVVTNEVGMGIVPESSLGRQFRDLAGLAHQRLSREADEVYFAALGTMLRIKPTLAAVVEESP